MKSIGNFNFYQFYISKIQKLYILHKLYLCATRLSHAVFFSV